MSDFFNNNKNQKLYTVTIVILIIAIVAVGMFFAYQFGYNAAFDEAQKYFDSQRENAYQNGYDAATAKFESEKDLDIRVADRIIDDFSAQCTAYSEAVNTSLAAMAEGSHTYTADEVSQMLEELDSLRSDLGSEYSKIYQGVRHNDPEYACISAGHYKDFESISYCIRTDYYTELESDTRFGDDYTDYYYDGQNELGVGVYGDHRVVWTLNLTYIDQGEPYSFDMGTGNYYTHYLYNVTDATQPAVVLFRNYDFNNFDYELVVINPEG